MDGGVIVARCLNDGRAVIDGCDFAFPRGTHQKQSHASHRLL